MILELKQVNHNKIRVGKMYVACYGKKNDEVSRWNVVKVTELHKKYCGTGTLKVNTEGGCGDYMFYDEYIGRDHSKIRLVDSFYEIPEEWVE